MNQRNQLTPYDVDLTLTPSTGSNPQLSAMSGRPPNPSYGSRRRAALSPQPTPVLISHPDDNPGPWTRRSASWSRAEDERLAQLVQREEANAPTTAPTKMWSRVAAQLTGRTGKQCRERWLNQLKPGIRRGLWTDDEEMILHQAHSELGNKWVAIAARLPGRTDNCVKNHWNSMLRKRQRREAAMRSAATAAHNAPPPPSRTNSTHVRMPTPLRAEVNSDLARRASTMAEGRNFRHLPSVNMYNMQQPVGAAFDGIPRMLLDAAPALSSPITPQRNAKLQIANLVAPNRGGSSGAGSSNVCGNAGFGVGGNIGTYGYDASQLMDSKNTMSVGGIEASEKAYTVLHPPLQLANPPSTYLFGDGIAVSAEQQLAQLAAGIIPPHGKKEDNHAVYVSSGFYPSTSPVTTPVGGIMPNYPSLDQRLWHSSFGLTEPRPGVPKASGGEGSELTTSADGGRPEDSVKRIKCDPRGDKKGSRLGSVKTISKARSNSSSLAALAAAASSVPPSPLTPESRFSCSRSVSPSPSGVQTRATSPTEVVSEANNAGRSVRRGAADGSSMRTLFDAQQSSVQKNGDALRGRQAVCGNEESCVDGGDNEGLVVTQMPGSNARERVPEN